MLHDQDLASLGPGVVTRCNAEHPPALSPALPGPPPCCPAGLVQRPVMDRRLSPAPGHRGSPAPGCSLPHEADSGLTNRKRRLLPHPNPGGPGRTYVFPKIIVLQVLLLTRAALMLPVTIAKNLAAQGRNSRRYNIEGMAG